LKKSIGILAIGQGAASIAVEFAKRRYDVAAMNLSKADLRAVERSIDARLELSGEGGAAKNRQIGQEAVRRNAAEIEAFLTRHFGPDMPHLKSLFVIHTLGGGTGSGAGPAVAALAAECLPDLIINPVVVFPDSVEADICQYNMLEAFEALSSLAGFGGTFILDNEQGRKLLGGNYYPLMNARFAELVDNLLTIPDRLVSAEANFDRREVLDLLSEPGQIGIYEAEVSSAKGWVPPMAVKRSWEESIFAKTTFTPRKAGIIIESPLAENLALMPILDTDPPVVHHGLYENGNRITTILAGMPFPIDRLKATETDLAPRFEQIQGSVAAYKREGIKSPFTKPRREVSPEGKPGDRAKLVLERMETK
jgi:hypothetical protein